MAETGWLCVHCGTQIPNRESEVCPNCEKNPFEAEPDERLQVHPHDMKKFLSTGKMKHQTTPRI